MAAGGLPLVSVVAPANELDQAHLLPLLEKFRQLAAMNPRLPPELSRRSPLAIAWRKLDQSLEELIDGDRQMIAA